MNAGMAAKRNSALNRKSQQQTSCRYAKAGDQMPAAGSGLVKRGRYPDAQVMGGGDYPA